MEAISPEASHFPGVTQPRVTQLVHKAVSICQAQKRRQWHCIFWHLKHTMLFVLISPDHFWGRQMESKPESKRQSMECKLSNSPCKKSSRPNRPQEN
ncbi:hypothetical protein J6590_080720 [Homalodisca vitripennis]|nr:hypothetical protein J6590_080720 [Homalodisca vitripennis]